MTRRGFWFLAASAGSLILSLALPAQFSLTLLGLTGLVWTALEWALFRLRVDLVGRGISIDRLINGQPAKQVTLWEDRPAVVRTRFSTTHWLGLPNVRVVDFRPASSDARGVWSREGSCRPRESIELQYEIIPRSPGRVVFQGALVEVTDRAGFFAKTLFLRDRRELAVLPSLSAERRAVAARKRDNRIPAHGVHRHLLPGSGTDLLNLRDYVIGDPPKRIAWKVSARRDRLITKEYESEVPIRAWLFVDASDSVRVGWPGPTALDQSVRIAAALTRELIAQRDPVGLVVVDDEQASQISPAPGTRQQTKILSELCRVAGRPPKPSPCHPSQLMDPAERLCKGQYPDLWDPSVNRRSLRLEWPWSRILRWPLGLALSTTVAAALTSRLWARGGNPNSGWIAVVGGGALLAWIVVGLWMWRRGRRASASSLRRRKRIASVLAAVQHLGAAGLAELIERDASFSRQTQQFLIDHEVAYARPLHDANGDYLFRSPGKIEQIARTILRAVAHAHDNEVFVLLLDLLEQEDHWTGVIDAIKIARSRHHQVLLVCPWPAELAVPTRVEQGRRDRSHGNFREATDLQIEQLLSERYFNSFESASRALSSVGVRLLVATVRDTPAEVLRRIEMVRAAKIPAHQ